MRSTRALLALVLAAALIGLTPAAYASPPDPTWVSGFWDDDDFDYVVLLVGNLKATMPVVLPRFDPATKVWNVYGHADTLLEGADRVDNLIGIKSAV